MSTSKQDKVMISEQQHLDSVVQEIKEKISYLENNKPYPEVQKYSTADAADRGDLRYKKTRNLEVEALIQEYFGYIDSPYFARMDLFQSNVGKEEVIYIGGRLLKVDDRILVYDWRSPVPNKIYDQSVLKFSHDKNDYEVLLRRKLDIKKSRLISYNDLYDYTKKIFAKGVTDPFLIEILREKHGEYRLTDIIRTIQENQNKIIQKPFGHSFIVQGCAGSGKTMILLHRVSYLKYNNPNIDLNKIKIITPSENFNLHINDLSDKLELDRIDHLSISQYYLYLLNQYDDQVWEKKKAMADSLLPNELVKEVYSMEFYQRCEDNYKSYIASFYRILDIRDINKMLKKRGYKPFNEYNLTDKMKLRSLISFINNVIMQNESKIRELKRNEISLEALQRNTKKETESIRKKRIREKQEAIKKLQKIIFSKEEQDSLLNSLKISEALDYRKIYKDTFSIEIENLYVKYNEDTSKIYVNNLFLYLHFYVLFEGKLANSDQLINIDEGQDIAPSEYMLFQLVNGQKTVFNIYGDVNQSTSPKGLKDWKELNFVNENFEIKENYRNTNEITGFCNKEFGYNITPIGISGDDVRFVNEDDGLALIKDEAETNKKGEERLAIIVHNSQSEVYKKLHSLDIQENSLENRKISLFTVEESKGLEFDKVYVFKKDMTKNEQYISYTRALNTLIVVK